MLLFALWLHTAALKTTRFVCLNGNPTVAQEFKQRYAVFTGTAVSEHYEPPLDKYFDQEGTTYEVRVEEVFKGAALPKSVHLFSENSSGRFPMTIGMKYLLFIYRDHGRLLVDNCGNSEQFSSHSKVLRTVQKLSVTNKPAP